MFWDRNHAKTFLSLDNFFLSGPKGTISPGIPHGVIVLSVQNHSIQEIYTAHVAPATFSDKDRWFIKRDRVDPNKIVYVSQPRERKQKTSELHSQLLWSDLLHVCPFQAAKLKIWKVLLSFLSKYVFSGDLCFILFKMLQFYFNLCFTLIFLSVLLFESLSFSRFVSSAQGMKPSVPDENWRVRANQEFPHRRTFFIRQRGVCGQNCPFRWKNSQRVFVSDQVFLFLLFSLFFCLFWFVSSFFLFLCSIFFLVSSLVLLEGVGCTLCLLV